MSVHASSWLSPFPRSPGQETPGFWGVEARCGELGPLPERGMASGGSLRVFSVLSPRDPLLGCLLTTSFPSPGLLAWS